MQEGLSQIDEEHTHRSRFALGNQSIPLGLVWSGREPGWRAALASLGFVAILTVVGFWIAPVVKAPSLAILYFLAVAFSALRWGSRAAIVSAVFAAFTWDFFFLHPERSMFTGEMGSSITIFEILTAALIATLLLLTAQREAKAAKAREKQTVALYSFTKSLAEASTLDQIVDAITQHILETFSRPIVLLLPSDRGLTVRFRSEELVLDGRDIDAAERVFGTGEEAGCGARQFPALKIRYRPLNTSQGIVGVLGILADRAHDRLPSNHGELLGTFLNLAALAITRANLSRRAQRVELLQETDKLQKALLNSVSHNLRTPITSVIGALNSVLEDGGLLDAATQRRLLQTAQDEATKLNHLVQNLLDMSRLEGGAIRVKSEPCDVYDVVGAALEQLGESCRRRSITIAIPDGLPLVPMDQVLIVQVLANLVDNALKYSPAETPIEIEARGNGAQLEIRVADRGKGIPEQDLERVFEKFFRGAPPGGPRGAGLGLSICKGFVHAHGGRIWARRGARGGTEVAFLLPMEAKR